MGHTWGQCDEWISDEEFARYARKVPHVPTEHTHGTSKSHFSAIYFLTLGTKSKHMWEISGQLGLENSLPCLIWDIQNTLRNKSSKSVISKWDIHRLKRCNTHSVIEPQYYRTFEFHLLSQVKSTDLKIIKESVCLQIDTVHVWEELKLELN